MHIVYCIGSLAKFGGAERVLLHKANYFANLEGYKVSILIAHQGNAPLTHQISEKVDCVDLRVNEKYKQILNFPVVGFFLRINELKKKYQNIINQIKPDIIINVERGFEDFIIPHLQPKIPCIRESHSSLAAVQIINSQNKNSLKEKIFTYLYNKQLQKYDYVIQLTEEDKNHRNYHNGKIVIPNLVPAFSLTPDYNKNSRKVISVGRLDRFKNFKDQIITWKKIVETNPEWTLHIYGSGPEGESLSKLIANLNLQDHVFLEGNSNEIEFKLKESSFFIFTSLAEGFGIVLVEAMQMGLPVVAYNCQCGPKDIIDDDINGFLVELGDLDAFENKIKELINNEEKRLEMSKNAILKSKMYQGDLIMPQWISLFNMMLNG